ncbi:MAG: hypothetical protein DBY30_07440 [Verrucomicrobia bacterium]|nr:MAG: hypothetical protein DBY30_07440 [Verrucomicrobiota bacterium]
MLVRFLLTAPLWGDVFILGARLPLAPRIERARAGRILRCGPAGWLFQIELARGSALPSFPRFSVFLLTATALLLRRMLYAAAIRCLKISDARNFMFSP